MCWRAVLAALLTASRGFPLLPVATSSGYQPLAPLAHPEEGAHFEGDIILRQGQIDAEFGRRERSLVARRRRLWPNATLRYAFSSEFDAEQRVAVDGALADLAASTCVRLERLERLERPGKGTFIQLRNTGLGCASPVGYHPTGAGIDLFLSAPGCQRRGTIQHEFLHALGFWHEHTRPDRDRFVSVVWPNIAPGMEYNFLKRPASEVQYEHMPYDYDSVMHYRAKAFSRDHESHTLEPQDPSAVTRMGQRVRFSAVDLAKLNRLYDCPSPQYYRGDDIVTEDSSTTDSGSLKETIYRKMKERNKQTSNRN